MLSIHMLANVRSSPAIFQVHVWVHEVHDSPILFIIHIIIPSMHNTQIVYKLDITLLELHGDVEFFSEEMECV